MEVPPPSPSQITGLQSPRSIHLGRVSHSLVELLIDGDDFHYLRPRRRKPLPCPTCYLHVSVVLDFGIARHAKMSRSCLTRPWDRL